MTILIALLIWFLLVHMICTGAGMVTGEHSKPIALARLAFEIPVVIVIALMIG